MQKYQKYQSLVQDAWKYYQQGNYSDMMKALEKSLEYTPYLKAETISDWVTQLIQFKEQENAFDIEVLIGIPEWNEVLSNYLSIPINSSEQISEFRQKGVEVAKIRAKQLPDNFKAISIMDEISEECWKYEFKNFPINRDSYKQQVESSSANIAFFESCWKGNRGTWEYAFTSPDMTHQNAQALLEVISMLKGKMPLVFWNKEDPMHYKKYLPIAKQANIIFTTDVNMLNSYRRDAPNSQVYALPFAAQNKICNPVDRFRIDPESLCFAGSYYGVGHDDRKRQMDALLPSILEFNGVIYDRMSGINSERYKFPEQYKPFIRNAIPFQKILEIYKKFKVFLNVNTIIDSPTMMSRRVYELLACGTPVVSTPSKAIEEQFSGIVQVANTAKEANLIIGRMLTDNHYWDKISHLGYREVMKKHTYRHRFVNLVNALGYEYEITDPLVSIITCTNRPHMIGRIVENITRQNHPNCELILVLQNFTTVQSEELLQKLKCTKKSNLKFIEVIVEDSPEVTLGERLNHATKLAQGEYIAKMDDDDFYFENYLSDMLIPFSFGDYAVVGKKELFMYLSGSKTLIRRYSRQRHKEVDLVAGATFVCKKEIFNLYKFGEYNRGEDTFLIESLRKNGEKIYATDPFNYIVYRGNSTEHTWNVADEYFLKGNLTDIISKNFNVELAKELVSF